MILVIIVMGIVLLVNHCTGGGCIRKIDKTLPDIQAAPWEVTTPTHLYYAREVEDDGDTVLMMGWYENMDGAWVKRSEPVRLERVIYGRIDVRRR
jgi:hypothetical protein